MTLGERICNLRTQRKLSQDELANALEVSRQSISKWETNSSVPELDKLVRLSEFFGVSLDELVMDKKPTPPTQPQVIYLERAPGLSAKKITGIVLLCFAGLLFLMLSLFGDILAGLVLATPFIACGVILLLIKKHAGLWCCWVIYLFIDIYLRFATGVTWSFVLLPQMYTQGWAVHLVVAWTLLLTYGILTIITAICLQKVLPEKISFPAIGAGISWVVYVLSWFLFVLPAYNGETDFIHSGAYRFVTALSGWIRSILAAAAIIFTLHLVMLLLKKLRCRK